MLGMKKCTCCKEVKDRSMFSKSKLCKDGYNFQCKACIKIAKAKWKDKNREHYLEDARKYAAKYRQQTPELAAAAYSKWAKKNRAYLNERDRRRKAMKIEASPVWANTEVMRVIYRLATNKTKLTGLEYHVDHIVPLVSKHVCGLHVEWNLQVLSKFENQSKSNYKWPDMWED